MRKFEAIGGVWQSRKKQVAEFIAVAGVVLLGMSLFCGKECCMLYALGALNLLPFSAWDQFEALGVS
jgi:hypothetical protein